MKSLFLRIPLLSAAIIFTSVFVHAQTLQDGIKLTNNEEFEKADKVFKTLQSAQPSVGNIYFYRGENYYNWGKMDSAQIIYQKGIDANALEPLNYIGLGKVQMMDGDSKSAMDNFYKAKTISKGKDPVVLAKLAEAYINVASKDKLTSSDLLNQAVSMSKEAIALDSKNATYHIDLADAYLAQNPSDGSKPVDEYNTAISLDPKNVNALLRLGQLWKNARDYSQSFDYFTKATKIDSTFAPAYREQAEMLYQAGRYDEAITAYNKYLRLNNSLTARGRYGSFLYVAKKYDEAITELQSVLSKDSGNIILYRLLGWSQYEKKDYKNGLLNMNKFFAKAKGTKIQLLANDYAYYGKLLWKNNQDSLAVIALNQAISMMNDPSSKDATDDYQIIAKIYSQDQNYTMAAAYYKKRIQANTQTANANDYFYLGIAQFNSKQYHGADSSFTMITQSNPDLSIGYQWRAKANAQIDSTQALSKPYFEQYIQKVGSDTLKNKDGLIEAYLELGYYYILQKDKTNAAIYYRKVLNLDADNANAKAYFESLKPRATKSPAKK